jgi:uncharacterized membrane protein YtjA (UPF0391 family)
MPPAESFSIKGIVMLKWALIFLVVSLVAGALGFTGVASGARTVAKVLFGIFLLFFIILVLLAWGAGELIF